MRLQSIPLEQILPNPDQPRKEFDEQELNSLAESIKEHGLIQAITVEGPYADTGQYILVDGERRWRAHKLAGLATIEAVVRPPNGHVPQQRFIHALVANLQRSDLNPIDEGLAYKKLNDNGMTQFAISRVVGRSAGSVSMRLKMIEFDETIQELFVERKLPIDPVVIYGLFKLPEELRTTMAVKYARKNMTTFGIRNSLSKAIKNLGAERDMPLHHARRAPAIAMSSSGEEAKIFKMLGKQSVNLPAWELVNQAAAETCADCELSDMASTSVCKDCPAVELLKRLNRLAAGKE